VVLPQGLRFAIPGWSNEFVYLIKYSSLAAFMGWVERRTAIPGLGQTGERGG